MRRHWQALSLFCGIVWRVDQTGYRMSARTAWHVARIVYYRAAGGQL